MNVRPLAFTAACLLTTAACSMPLVGDRSTRSVQPWPPANAPAAATDAAATKATAAQAPASQGVEVVPVADVAPPAPDATPRVVEPQAFRIGPEDILDVQVWKNADLSRVVPVRPDGMISLPLVNDIQAAGLTPNELRHEITRRLSEFIPSPEVSVIVREVHSVKVAVLGNVKMPGHYEVNGPATVLELISRAQGLTEFADRGRIVVLRQKGATTTRIPFNYRKVAEGTEQDNFYVRPGDIIVVP